MSETDNIQYAPIRNYNYEEFFYKYQYNGRRISDDERKEIIKELDATIAEYSEGFPTLKEALDSSNGKDDIFHKALRTIDSVFQFVVITFVDCLVISKYFLLADKDYDKRFMRGKMKVILNEGFKKLYGFGKKTKEEPEWSKLAGIIEHLSPSYQFEYKKLSYLLDKHSKSSSWWKEERNIETHLETEKLYESRCEDIVEGEVMEDAIKLINTLYAIQLFTSKLQALFFNALLENYRNQEVKNGGHNL